MSGTALAYAAISLRARYAESGTDSAYGGPSYNGQRHRICPHASNGRNDHDNLRGQISHSVLGSTLAPTGTTVATAGTKDKPLVAHPLACYAHAMQCPVLIRDKSGNVLQSWLCDGQYWHRLSRVRYARCGVSIGYYVMRCAVRWGTRWGSTHYLRRPSLYLSWYLPTSPYAMSGTHMSYLSWHLPTSPYLLTYRLLVSRRDTLLPAPTPCPVTHILCWYLSPRPGTFLRSC
eukprot:3132607-Rhodomonas_salina.1